MKKYILALSMPIFCLVACESNQSRVNSNQLISEENQEITDQGIQDHTLVNQQEKSTISSRFDPPMGYARSVYKKDSYQFYLSTFPLLPEGEKVHLFDGSLKWEQEVHTSILDIDVGNQDLQQCADAIMRLRSEYLYKQKRYNDISFNFTNGWNFAYSKWRAGDKLIVKGNNTYWTAGGEMKTTYQDFRSYLNQVFMYAGTLSLSKELKSKNLDDIEIGDLIIQGGTPGHAVLVIDMCMHHKTGKKAIMLAQSYMPAQQFHILKNMLNSESSPWYLLSEIGSEIKTPEWTFSSDDVMTF